MRSQLLFRAIVAVVVGLLPILCIGHNLYGDESIKNRIVNATVFKSNPGGKFLFIENGGIYDQSHVSIKAADGLIRFIGGPDTRIDGQSSVLLEAKDIKIRNGSSITGGSVVFVIISNGGSLYVENIDQKSQLFFCKSNDDDVEPKIVIRKIGDGSSANRITFTEMIMLIGEYGF